MKRSTGALVAVSLVLGLGACGSGDDDYTEVCVDQNNMRVDDNRCGNHALYPGVFWIYYPIYTVIPAYGYVVPVGGQRTLPPGRRLSNQRPPSSGGQLRPTRAQQKQAKQAQQAQQQKQSQSKSNWPQYRPPASQPRPPAGRR